MKAAGKREFVKMSGSGNDFVMVDCRTEPPGELAEAGVISAICARATGVGADGIVFLMSSDRADLKLEYLNSDGSLADLCGNATLCTARLAVRLGAAKAEAMVIETGAGLIRARILGSGQPEIDLGKVSDVQANVAAIPSVAPERRIGFATAGIPHLVIEVPDVDQVDLIGRGRPLRWHRSLPSGANVNFIASAGPGVWKTRTYERGVEGETLACGTGAVAAAVLIATWSDGDPSPVRLRTRSGRELAVSLRRSGSGWLPSLSGEARMVFEGRLDEI